ncbi:ATP-binding protein [Planctomycetota bacterium]
MDPRFFPHNTHLDDPAEFRQRDPQLRLLAREPLVHEPAMLRVLPVDTPGIYTVGGGRQVGKTTLLKLWMARLLELGVQPRNVTFLTGELIDDHHVLLRLMQEQLQESEPSGLRFLLLDEVTYVRDWDRAVKYAADAGMLERTVVVITGSDLLVVKEARRRLPGRRGLADKVDFQLQPLSFREAVELKVSPNELSSLLEATCKPSPEELDLLFREFDQYLIHGGYLTALNDMARHGAIRAATLCTYSDWIRGDMGKRGKQEPYLREVLGALVKRYGSQITWNALGRDLSIDHPKTVADYCELLASMDAVFIQPALVEDKLCGAPKKARKVTFSDPFIYHAVRAWLSPTGDPYTMQILPLMDDPEQCSRLVEACVATQLRRLYPTYYIKSVGEVDVAFVSAGRFWPVEVKWSRQLRPKDLKQIRKYENGRILARTRSPGALEGVPVQPLPLALLRLPWELSAQG